MSSFMKTSIHFYISLDAAGQISELQHLWLQGLVECGFFLNPSLCGEWAEWERTCPKMSL